MDCIAQGDGWGDSLLISHGVGYYRAPSGMVYLRGVAHKCGAAGSVVFNLPAGFRPEGRAFFAAATSVNIGATDAVALARLTVQTSGDVETDFPASDEWVSLNGIVFRCGPAGQNGCP